MILKIILLACVQGIAELLPVSSSAHVIVAQKLMGLDPSAPQMTFLLVMLHTGTMVSVLIYFWSRWMEALKNDPVSFIKAIVLATAATGIIGLGLKKFIEKVIFSNVPHAEIETLFSNLPLIAAALFCVGILIIISGLKKKRYFSTTLSDDSTEAVTSPQSIMIGIIQGICLPFRGFSRSGATISTGLLLGMAREKAEQFSFALAVVLTPAAIFLEGHRLLKANASLLTEGQSLGTLFFDGFLGMFFSAIAGFIALKWLSSWLEKGRWHYFGYYCLMFSGVVFLISSL